MSYIGRGRNGLNGFAVGLLLLGISALPIAGCSELTGTPPSDETAASTPAGSSMKLQAPAAADHSTSDATAANPPAVDAQATAPATAAAAAVPAPLVPPVTSPTTTALEAAAPVNPSPVSPNLGQTNPPATVVASTGPILKGLDNKGMQGTAQTLNPVMMRALKQFQVASASFPDFCREWSRKLSAREHDNLGNIKWELHDGVETGTYVGYGPISSCTCKEATNGVAVGILTYKEFDYTLTGKSIEEAEHSTPHPATVVPTREIFAYDKGKWFW
jgi:hypothetical protein